MKRFFSFVLVFFILACFSTHAIASKADAPFSLRNGYQWGMGMEQVLALAAEEGFTVPEYPLYAYSWVTIEAVPVGRFTATSMKLSFDKMDRLIRVSYSFDVDSISFFEAQEITDWLAPSLKSLYGEPKTEVDNEPFDVIYEWETEDTRIRASGTYVRNAVNQSSWTITYEQREPLNIFGL